MVMKISDDEFLRQFRAKIESKTWGIEYSLQERKIFLTKLILPNEENEESEDTQLFITSVLNEIRNRKLKAMPTCSALKKFFKAHKEYYDLLPAGIRM